MEDFIYNNKVGIKQPVRKELRVRAYAKHFDANVTHNGKWIEDDCADLKMPCIEKDKNNKPVCWCPVIDPVEGKMLNWKDGVEAEIGYAVYDQCELEYVLIDGYGNEGVVVKTKGYVPMFLQPREYTFGKNIEMDIAGSGKIYKWSRDMFNNWVVENIINKNVLV